MNRPQHCGQSAHSFLCEFVGQFRKSTEAFQEPFKAIETHFGHCCLGAACIYLDKYIPC